MICDGSLPSLTALWSEAQCEARARAAVGGGGGGEGQGNASAGSDGAGRVVAWGLGNSDSGEAWHDLVRRQAQACGVTTVEFAPVGGGFTAKAGGGDGEPNGGGLEITRMLLSAGESALEHGLTRIVWPVALGMGEGAIGPTEAELVINAISGAADRALLCSRLLAIETEDRARHAGRMELDAGGRFMIQTPYLDLGESQLVELALDMDVPLGLVEAQACAANARWLRVIERLGAATLIRPAA